MLITESELRRIVKKAILVEELNRGPNYRLIGESLDADIAAEIPNIASAAKKAQKDGDDPQEEIEAELEDLVGDDIDLAKLKKVIQKENRNRNLSERKLLTEGGIGLMLFGCALATPKLVSLLVSLVAKIKGVQKHLDSHGHTHYDDKFLNTVEGYAHTVHEWFLKASGGLVNAAYRAYQLMRLNPKKALAGMPEDVKKEWASKTFMLIVGIMFVMSGLGAVAATSKYVAATEAIAASVKGVELAEFGAPIAKGVLTNPEIISQMSKMTDIIRLAQSVFML